MRERLADKWILAHVGRLIVCGASAAVKVPALQTAGVGSTLGEASLPPRPTRTPVRPAPSPGTTEQHIRRRTPMMSVDNKAIIRRFYEEVWDERNPEVVDHVVSPSHAL